MIKDKITDEQVIYINMDDSGRLVKGEPNELVFVYGGVFFLSLTEQENFSRQYKAKDSIFDSKASKGRFKDYIIKREVKKIVENLISQNRINSQQPVKLVLNLDEQSTVSNGYYDLESSIKEELQFGIMNYNYGISFPPILSSVRVNIKYKNSYYNYPVQAADLLVGEVRHAYYNYLQNNDFVAYKKRTNFLNTSIYLP